MRYTPAALALALAAMLTASTSFGAPPAPLDPRAAALVEKGAVEKARRNLSRLQQICGGDCEASKQLAAAIAKGPTPRIVTAEAVQAKPVVTPN